MLKDFTLSLELEPTENRVVQTAAIFWSHDVNTAKIYIELLRKGTPIILNKNVTVRVMMLFDDENKSEHIYTAKIEDELKGLVSITLEESMRMYVGQVTCGVYVDYQNEEKTDNGYFTFGMRRSLIDKDMPELQKLYVSDFEKALEKFKEIEKKIEQNDVVTHPELKEYTYTKKHIDENIQELSDLKANKDEVLSKKETNKALDSKADKLKTEKALNELERKKADQSFVDAQLSSIVSGAPKGTYKTLQALKEAYPDGTEGVFLVLENGHWYYYADGWKDGGVYQSSGIADNSITPKKTTFIDTSDNIFNKKDVLLNHSLDDSSGLENPSTTYSVSDFIKVEKNATYKMSTVFKVLVYSSKTQVEKVIYNSVSDKFNTEDNRYIRVVFVTTEAPDVSIVKADKEHNPNFYKELDSDIKVNSESMIGKVKATNLEIVSGTNNLINVNDVIKYHVINDDSGLPVPSDNYNVTDFIKVDIFEEMSTYDVYKVVRYNENKKVISNVYLSKGHRTFNTYQATYVRLTIYKDSQKPMLNYGEQLKKFDDGIKKISEEIYVEAKNVKGKIENSNIKAIKESENLINRENIIEYRLLKDNTGEVVDNNLNAVTDFIKVDPDTAFNTRSLIKVIRYDKNKKFISQTHFSDNVGKMNTYQAEYIRTMFKIQNKERAYFGTGDPETYNKALHKESLSSEIALSNNQIFKEDKKVYPWIEDFYVLDTVCHDYFELDRKLEGVLDLQVKNVDFIHEKYDTLMKKYPGRITRKVEEKTKNGLEVRSYTFKQPRVPNTNIENDFVQNKKAKMLLFACVHGEEKLSALNLFNVMREITENWKKNKVLEMLYWNVDFVVIPVVNPEGFNNNTRKTENNVDIGRNFAYGHGKNGFGESSPEYGGKEPFTEAGSIAIKNIIEREKDIIFSLSHHTFMDTPETDNYFWYSAGSKLQVRGGKNITSLISRKMAQKFPELPQERYYGYASAGQIPGGETTWIVKQNIQASVFELCPKIVWLDGAERYDSNSVTQACEVLVNTLSHNLINCINYYNR